MKNNKKLLKQRVEVPKAPKKLRDPSKTFPKTFPEPSQDLPQTFPKALENHIFIVK